MGIGLIWQNSVTIALQNSGVAVSVLIYEKFELILCNDTVLVHLISFDNNYTPDELIALQGYYQQKNITLVQLWEDIWYTRQAQVVARIKSLLGLNKRLHGRKGKIDTISQKQADDFLNENHIQQTAKAKYRFALDIDGQTVAVACFSNTRLMKRISDEYRSVELIRFATLHEHTVIGGFTKLLRHFINLIKPNDVMSYADRDWSLGNAYEQSGFKLAEITPPARIWVSEDKMVRIFSHRLPVATQTKLILHQESWDAGNQVNGYLPVFNTGNLKYILYL